MNKTDSTGNFDRIKCDWIPENINNDIGLFNVFRLEPFVGDRAKPVPYKKRDFYKITLVTGPIQIHYADKVVELKKQALIFSNPMIPYKWENTENVKGGFFCVFNKTFFHKFGDLSQYPVLQPEGTHVFELTDEQAAKVKRHFERMEEEINSDYMHKYDLLRTIVIELLHFAMKMEPSMNLDRHPINANKRISFMFLELLERQFPVDDNHPRIHLRYASDFAQQLNIHVNHLNRALKETTGKTTSQLIGERILQESKVLLKHSVWNVNEIAYALGFSEINHFDNFFKKHSRVNPLKFRNV